jgi:hypothetical protein
VGVRDDRYCCGAVGAGGTSAAGAARTMSDSLVSLLNLAG